MILSLLWIVSDKTGQENDDYKDTLNELSSS